MGNIAIKDLGAAAKKFSERAALATSEYKSGIAGSGDAWQRNTVAGADNYAQGVTAAIGRDAFSKGVKASGGAYFEQRATDIGGNRYAEGVRAGAANWSEGFQPYATALQNLNLPPRAPKGDPRNMQRATDVAMALRKAKTGQ